MEQYLRARKRHLAEERYGMEPDTPTGRTIGSKGAGEGRCQSDNLFDVKENELDTLQKGVPADLYLNFAIFLLSLSFSAIIALATSVFKYPLMELVAVIVAFLGFVVGTLLLCMWWQSKSTVREVCKRIRARIPPDPAPPQFAEYQSNWPNRTAVTRTTNPSDSAAWSLRVVRDEH